MVLPGSCLSAVSAGMTALQLFYNSGTGLWNTTQWWNSANALESTIDYARITESKAFHGAIANTFKKHQQKKFLSPWFQDDDGWWALTWIKAYDLTGEKRYLSMSKIIFNDMRQGWNSSCGGGLWWHKKQKNYKNAITNALFLTIAARLHARTPNDYGKGSYLDWAQRSWTWFKQSGMINPNNLVNDGLDKNCRNNGQTTWTYNQGVLMGGLIDLYRSTKDVNLLRQADAIAASSIRVLAPQGILKEPCEPDCGKDGPQFKGIFMRNLSLLHQISPKNQYQEFMLKNASMIWAQNRNPRNQFGLTWGGPFDLADAARQSSAIDALNAALSSHSKGKQCDLIGQKPTLPSR
jgi:predicted alpha-1,6-mannanase (GH76 family)